MEEKECKNCEEITDKDICPNCKTSRYLIRKENDGRTNQNTQIL